MSALLPSKKSTNKLWEGLGRVLYVLAWPALYVYLRRGGERTRLIVTANDKILLVKDWLGDGSWKLPGGGLHKGEAASVGALRELAEETGLVAKANQLKPLGLTVSHGHGFNVTIRSFWLQLPKTSALSPQAGEILEARWLPVEEVLKRCNISDSTRLLIEQWGGQL